MACVRKLMLSCLLGAAFLASVASAAEVATHPDASISSVDIQAEMATLAPVLNEAVRNSPTSAQNLAADLLARRIVAGQARESGLESDPLVAARVRLAAERALYEAYMEKRDLAVAEPVLVERQARDEYRAFPEKFRSPEQIRARHILIPACVCAPERVREQAEAILARLQAGESFEDIARQESADKGSAAEGGDLGFFARGKMVPPFEEAAFALKQPGELSGLVPTQFGIHIIRLEERKLPAKQSFDDVREALMADVAARLKRAERVRILTPIREPGAISYDADALKQAVTAD